MSGHSKWAKIAGKKAITDQKRSGNFTKLIRNIIVAAKDGPDPDSNFKLRLAVDKAREANMPKDNVERAILRGSGQSGEGQIEEVIYEGFGPGGVAVLVEGTTDNRNRTTSEVKHLFTSVGGAMGGPNSVKWMFEHKGVMRLSGPGGADSEAFQLELIDLGADDVIEEEGGFTIYTSFDTFPAVKKALEARGLKLDYAQDEWIAKDRVDVTPEVTEKIEKLTNLFEDNDDVSNYYTNANL
jgi:YebC/PmpR family DNA-binding regulatory protein